MIARSLTMVTAGEGWRALYAYGEGQTGVCLSRLIAAWCAWPDELVCGMVIDDLGNLAKANEVDRFICYCAPDDNPEEIIRRRAAGK